MKKLILILLVIVCIPALAASSEKAADNIISIPLQAQIWLQTKTANVTIDVSAASKDSGVTAMQKTILSKLKSLSDADWHVVSLSRNEGQSRLINLMWRVQARVPLADVNIIAGKAKSMSESGIQFNLANTDYSPSFADRQNGQVMLRDNIYVMAKKVLDQANQAFPSAGYKIKSIHFAGQYKLPVLHSTMLVKMNKSMQTIPVARRVTMNAVVELGV